MNNLISKKLLREFGFLLGVIFPLLIGWIIPLLTGHGFRVWTIWIGIPLLFLSVFAPQTLRYPYRFWMIIGHTLGFINSHIILGLVFLFVVQPIALIMRSFGYDPLRKKKIGATTYREKRKTSKIDLTRIF
tara:strand:- start:185 stop:577 length:393 start_codon:yes stop_codon:yes gene_type:complete